MSENTSNIVAEKSKGIDWILWGGITIYLLAIIGLFGGYSILDNHDIRTLKLNELGDFLSGIFAPLAFFILIIGYIKQNQVQQKTEKFLQEQSKALTDQLDITKKQYDNYITELELNKPYFQLNKFNEVRFRYAPERPDSIGDYFQCRFEFINLRKPTNIILITVDTPILNTRDNLWIDAKKLENQDIIEITSNFPIEPDERIANGEFNNSQYSSDDTIRFFMTETQRATEKICEEYLLSCIININYASEFSSGMDSYKFIIANGKYQLRKLQQHSQTYAMPFQVET